MTHGIGAGLAVAALVLLIVKAVFYAPPGQTAYYVVSWTIFGSTLIILYMMSTLYHALTPRKAKAVFAIFDHSAIYLLIAGTYTPFCLGSLRGSVGWTLFGIIWGLAIIGIVMYSIFGKKARVFSVITYLIMGWLIVFAFGPMRQVLPQTSLSFLIAGGSAYTLGVIFYSLKKIKWMHPIWHLFVLAGSIFHFFAVYFSI
ncbi:MAG: hemolysin III family protein [Spirochaetales bacterium]